MTAVMIVGIALGIGVVAAAVTVIGIRRPDWLLPGAAALGVLLCRPSVVGEPYPSIGPAVLVLVAVVAGADAVRRGTRDVGVAPWPFLLFGLAWVWLGIHRLLVPAAEANYVSSTVTNLIPVFALYFVVRDRDLLRRTVAALVALVVVSATLTVVASALVLVAGPGATLVGSVPLGYTGGSGLYLPGALSYGADGTELFPRMLGLGREPGMGALLLGFAYFAMPATFPRPVLQRTILLLALLATQSTAGIGVVGVCLLLQGVVGRRRFSPALATVAVVGGAAVIYLALYAPSFGLFSKIDSTGNSFSTRSVATANGISAMVDQPFTAFHDGPVASVNLIATIAVNGLPWSLLAGAFLLAPVIRARRRDPWRYGSLVVFLVMLTSQPLMGNAGVLLLPLIAYYAADRSGVGPAAGVESAPEPGPAPDATPDAGPDAPSHPRVPTRVAG